MGYRLFQRQAIIWTIAVYVNKWEYIPMHFDSKYKKFEQENAFENVVCKMAAILSRPQCVKHGRWSWRVRDASTSCQTGTANYIKVTRPSDELIKMPYVHIAMCVMHGDAV